jgi:enoyl-CoA hydratase/carnithine racemase
MMAQGFLIWSEEALMKLTAFKFGIYDGVARITLNQAFRNLFDRRSAAQLDQLLTECSVNPDVGSVLIDAKGRLFSAGGDQRSGAGQAQGELQGRRYCPDQ